LEEGSEQIAKGDTYAPTKWQIVGVAFLKRRIDPLSIETSEIQRRKEAKRGKNDAHLVSQNAHQSSLKLAQARSDVDTYAPTSRLKNKKYWKVSKRNKVIEGGDGCHDQVC